ncbi:hypothetical protein GLYMA_16G143850v4 [Glycine max]|nr:hypothetical protein GLYMA_16G143850v4 [Glycine max]KAH1151419.1 hypothetical protein GYH30_045095 [Glycine max]
MKCMIWFCFSSGFFLCGLLDRQIHECEKGGNDLRESGKH